MRSKTKIILLYLVALVLSHVTEYFGDNAIADLDAEFEVVDGGAVYLVFGRAGGSNPEVDRLVNALEVRDDAAVWELSSLRELDGLRGRLAVANPSRIEIVGIGYGSIEAVNAVEGLGMTSGRLTLVSPVVSTRFELLGDERLNAALKTFQLAWFWVFENAVPHFGYSKSLPYSYATSLRIFEADQSMVSSLFSQQQTETRIFYSEGGRFARSGALAAYQSVRPDVGSEAYGDVEELVSKILSSGPMSLLQRDEEREGERYAFEDFSGVSLNPIWAGFLLAVSTLASEDFACIGGGLLASSGSVGLWPAILGCLLGIFLGDLAIYFIGRAFGATALELPVLKHMVSAKALNRSADWFEKRGIALVVLTRFFPGSRVPTYFAAGVVKVGWVRFTLALLLASAIWTPILVLASYYLGAAFLDYFESLGGGAWLAIVAFIVVFAVGVRVVSKLATWKGRRLLLGRWRRLTRWEFWPMWAVYAPVIPYILWLAIRYRSVSLPFSVNPCMPASGLVYESKIQILSHLERAGVPIGRFEAIDLELTLEEKLDRVSQFIDSLELSYPVVLKPDVGQRGQGVVIAKDLGQVRSFFEGQKEDTIVQEYIDGTEFGVFYHRFAGKRNGEVSGVTDKRTTWVVGDGESTLEKLILKDDRAVCMAAFFLREYESQLAFVPSEGDRFMLASIGTHSRGAIFLDGASLMTPALSAEIDRFSRVVEGFYFGRYDLRVPSEEALMRGESIRVIELNGITSEPTHMYDPKHGPLFGWSRLMEQWRTIFALAKENRLAGHEPVSKRSVVKLAIGHFRGLASRDLV